MAEQPLFNNDHMTELVLKFNANGNDTDPRLIGEILSGSNNLIMVIASKFSRIDDDFRDDLMQEGRVHMLKAIPGFQPDKGKLYSYFSFVIRNAMIDFLRRQKPTIELTEFEEEPECDPSEADYVMGMAGDMIDWFKSRFPTILTSDKRASDVLIDILSSIIDLNCGKRKGTQLLIDNFGMDRQDALVLYDAVLVKLRMQRNRPNCTLPDPDECTLHPELIELIGDRSYQRTKSAFDGLVIKFVDK